MTAAFTVNPALTGIAMAYRNAAMIADAVLPRLPVGTKEFLFHELPMAEAITVPNTLVGRKSAPRQVEFGMVPKTGMALDYGLDDVVPNDDITQAAAMRAMGAVFDPKATAVQNLTDLVGLDREIRVANKVFSAGTYSTSNRVLLSGTSQWSDPLSAPITAITDALDVPMMRPNVAVLGQTTWTKLRRNPALVKAANKSAGDSGIISQDEFKEMFELEELLIGSGWVNIAKPGQPPVRARVWGRHAAFIHRDKLATASGQRATFGFTGQFGGKVVGERPDGDVGLRGSIRVRSGETVAEVISAPDLGFFFENAVAG
jgi:hypothetical protein